MGLKRGDVVVCVDAREPGIPLAEGAEYTVRRYHKAPNRLGEDGDGGPIEELRAVDGLELVEVPGRFLVTRFAERGDSAGSKTPRPAVHTPSDVSPRDGGDVRP